MTKYFWWGVFILGGVIISIPLIYWFNDPTLTYMQVVKQNYIYTGIGSVLLGVGGALSA